MIPAIRVENLSKHYRLGETHARSVRDLVNTAASRLFRRGSYSGRKNGSATNGTLIGDDASDFWALKDVSFEVQPGEVVGIIGRNGAGKSTLLKILSQIVAPTTGRIELRGRVASLLEVGTGFHPELTGRENVYLNGTILGMTKPEVIRKFDAIVAFAEIEQFIDTPVKRYSSGMYVRLAFAVAAHLDPEILIIDEVLAVGDLAFQRKCIERIRSTRHTGQTVLVVSHNMGVMKSLCMRCLLLNHGTAEHFGSTEDAIRLLAISCPSHHPNETDIVVDREAKAHPRIARASLWSNGAERKSIRLGDPISLVIEYEAEPKESREQIFIGLVISTAADEPIINANNRYQAQHSLWAGPEGQIQADLGVVPLMPGDYAVSLWIGNANRDTHQVTNALRFTVQPWDHWGQGMLPPAGSSLMWWPTIFTLQNHTSAEHHEND